MTRTSNQTSNTNLRTRTYNESRNLTKEEADLVIKECRARDEVVPKVVMARYCFPGVPVAVSIPMYEELETEQLACYLAALSDRIYECEAKYRELRQEDAEAEAEAGREQSPYDVMCMVE